MKKTVRLLLILSLLMLSFSKVFAAGSGVSAVFVGTKPGNIFVGNEAINVKLSLEHHLSKETEFTISTTVKNSEGVRVAQGTYRQTAVPGVQTICDVIPQTTLFGIYEVETLIGYPGGEQKVTTEFSRIVEGSPTPGGLMGSCLHIHRLKKDDPKLSAVMTLLKQAGIRSARDDCYWNATEKTAGVYEFYNEDSVNALVENGIEPLLILNGGNSVHGGVPHTTEGYAAFAAFCGAVAEHYKGKVKQYEIWNEWNGNYFNDGYGTEHYIEILKAAYTAIKSVDPDIQVIAGATITAANTWFKTIFDAGCFDYCDAISYHPYCFPSPPDQKSDQGTIENNFSKMYNMMLAYGEPKAQYITEMGWHTSTAEKSVSESLQACYIARMYILGKAYGLKRVYGYDFKNDGSNAASTEHNYGMIRSWEAAEPVTYAAKPAYLSAAMVSNSLADMEFVKEYRPSENIRLYRFTDGTRDCHVAYAIKDENEFYLSGSNARLKVYDLFGNECSVTKLTPAPVYIFSQAGEFNVQEILTKTRERANASLGYNHRYDGLRIIGLTQNVSYGGRNCIRLGKSSIMDKLTCDIDDTYMYGTSYNVKVSIDYYDGSSIGSFSLNYRSGGLIKSADIITKGTSAWKTAEIILNQAELLNGVEGGDFQIIPKLPNLATIYIMAVRITPVVSGKPICRADFTDSAYQELNSDTGMLNTKIKFDHMSVYLPNYGVGCQYVERNGRGGVYATQSNNARFVCVDVDDDLVYGGKNKVVAEVDYFDEGNGKFDIAYDVGKYTTFTETNQVVQLQNTQEWKTAVFNLDPCWFENYCNGSSDFRVALWTNSMSSTEGVIFGGIRVYFPDEAPDFDLSFNEKTNLVSISGYLRDAACKTPVTLELLQIGKTADDIKDKDITGANYSDTIRYFSDVMPQPLIGCSYYSRSFAMKGKSGKYLMRVLIPEADVPIEKYLYYYHLYDVESLRFSDQDGKVLAKTQIAGIDFFNVSLDFTSNVYDTDVCMIVAVYDENKAIKRVEMVQTAAVKGNAKELSTDVELNGKLNPGDFVKIMLLKDVPGMVPLSEAMVIYAK